MNDECPYVLYSYHLAALAEKDKRIRELEKVRRDR
jgi:hypothetical protein